MPLKLNGVEFVTGICDTTCRYIYVIPFELVFQAILEFGALVSKWPEFNSAVCRVVKRTKMWNPWALVPHCTGCQYLRCACYSPPPNQANFEFQISKSGLVTD